MTPRAACAALMVALVASGASAQQPNREQEQLRRARQQLQQVQQEAQAAQEQAARAALESRKATEERDALQKRLGGMARLRAENAGQARRLGELEAQLSALRLEHEGVQARLAETGESLKKTAAELAQARERLSGREGDLAGLEARHKLQAEQLASAVRHNAALHALGRELLGRYQDKGVMETLSAREPFLQIKRVELENLAQDYRDKLDAERVKPAKGP